MDSEWYSHIYYPLNESARRDFVLLTKLIRSLEVLAPLKVGVAR